MERPDDDAERDHHLTDQLDRWLEKEPTIFTTPRADAGVLNPPVKVVADEPSWRPADRRAS